MTAANVSPAEIARFDQLASRWWDPDGESRPLHDLNPVRTAYIAARAELRGARVADVGCGGGLLSESLARAGAHVTGIDLGEKVTCTSRTCRSITGCNPPPSWRLPKRRRSTWCVAWS